MVESDPSLIGHITLDAKCAGARSAGNPHAACEAVGAGNGTMASRTEGECSKETFEATGKPNVIAPALDLPASSARLAGDPQQRDLRGVTLWNHC